MKKILSSLAGLLLLCCASAALAGTASLSWVNATTRTDGSPLTNLASINIYRGTSATGPWTKIGSVTVPTTTYTDATAPNGVTAYYVLSSVDATGLEGPQSAPVNKAIPAAPPSPPSGITITAVTAFYVIQQTDRFVMLPVGTVPANTPCDGTQSVNGYHVVPRSSVTWLGTVRPAVVVAQCG